MSLGKKFFHQNPADSSGSGAATAQDGLVLHLDANDEDSIESGGANQGNGSGTWFDIANHDLVTPLVDKASNLILNLDGGIYTSGAWQDQTTNTNNAALNGNAAYNSDVRGYFTLDGTGDYLQITDNSSLNLGAATYEMWFRQPSYAADEHFFGRFEGDGARDFFVRTNGTSGGVDATFYNGSTAIAGITSSNGAYSANEWSHFAVTLAGNTSGSAVKLYVNGTLQGSTTLSANRITDAAANLYLGILGSAYTGDYEFTGDIGTTRIYNVALTASEVAQNFRAGNFLSYSSIITSKQSATQGTLITVPPTQGTIHSTNLALSLDANGYTSGAWSNTANSSYNATVSGAIYTNNDNSDYFDFDGSNDYAEVSAYAGTDIGSGGFTLEAWCLCEASSGQDTIASNLGDSDTTGYQLYIDGGTGVKLYIYSDSANYRQLTATSAITQSTWNHCVFTVASASNGAAIKLYVNGTLKDSDTLNSNYTGADHGLDVGRYPYTDSKYFDGKIAQIRTYSAALTTTEVNTNYNATKDLYQGATNIELNLDANGYSSGAWSDSSGNGRNGTITDAVHTNDNNSDYFTFDGATGTSGDKVVVPHTTDLDIVQDFSIEMWVWRNDDTDHCLINKGPNNTNSWDISFGASSGFGYQFNSYDGNAQVRTGTGDFTSANRWEHIVLTYDNTTRKPDFFIDGVLRVGHTQTAGSLPNGNSNDLIIGGYYQYPAREGWNGRIAQVRFYKGKLTQDQVITNYNATKSLYQNPTLEIHLDAADDTTLSNDQWSDKANSNHANISSTVGFSGTLSDFYDKELGNWLVLDGSNDNMTIPSNSNFQNATAFTVEMWIEPISIADNEMLSTLYTASNDYKWDLRFHSASGDIRWGVADSSGEFASSQDITTTDTLSTGNWHHLVATYDGLANTQKIFFNGIEVKAASSPTAGTRTGGSDDIDIGHRVGSFEANIKIGQYRLYNTSLTSAQVAQNYLATKNDYPNDNNATITGATFYGTSPSYFIFDGSNDKMEITHSNDVQIDGPYTWMFWFRPHNTNSGKYLMSKVQAANYGQNIILQSNNVIRFTGYSAGGSGSRHETVNNAFTDNNWQHLAITIEGNKSGDDIDFYINGSQVSHSTGTYSSTTLTQDQNSDSSNSSLFIGAYQFGSTTNNFFDGDIGYFKCFKKQLSSSEILAEYNATKATFE